MLLRRAVSAESIPIEDAALVAIAQIANGDARTALNIVELAQKALMPDEIITSDLVQQAAQRQLLYDKGGEEHFNIISALHKSLRNSDVDASLYWLARMLESGEDPLYVARRLVRFASEDIGLADNQALRLALDAKEAFEFIGLPEGKLALAQCVAYLAAAPKSNSIYVAYSEAAQDVAQTRNDPVPLHLRNAPTGLMKGLGYGAGYQYSHDVEGKVADMDCLPEALKGRRYFHPQESGHEAEIKKRIEEIRRKRGQDGPGDS
jgi:putative ATPase